MLLCIGHLFWYVNCCRIIVRSRIVFSSLLVRMLCDTGERDGQQVCTGDYLAGEGSRASALHTTKAHISRSHAAPQSTDNKHQQVVNVL